MKHYCPLLRSNYKGLQGAHLNQEVSSLGASRRSHFIALVIVGALSALWARYVLGPAPLDIHNTHWIWGDLAQVYVAWAQYLSDPHHHGLLTDRMSYPLPMSISLFDPMPLFLLASRPIAGFVPGNTQYIGLYFTICLVLQGIFGYLATLQALRLVGGGNSKEVPYISAIGGLLIATIPFTFFRFQYHTALSSQWALVLAIWSTLSTFGASRSKWLIVNCLTMFLATGVNPYLALMVAMSTSIPVVAQLRKLGVLEAFVRVAALAATAAIGLYLFGFLAASGADSEGYGLFSMNALGPLSSNGLGRIDRLKVSDATTFQSLEGFDYLGAGVIALIAMATVSSFVRRRTSDRFPYFGALLVIALAYLLALSTTPTIGSHRFHLPAPTSVEFLLSRFRSSGRLFWIAGFWIVVTGLAILTGRIGTRRSAIALTAILFLQITDIQPVAYATKISMANASTQVLSGIPPGAYEGVFVFPGWQCDHDKTPLGIRNYESVGFFVAKNHIPTNNFYAARNLPDQIAYHCDYSRIAERIRPNGIYLLSSQLYKKVERELQEGHLCNNESTGDGSWVCVPKKTSAAHVSSHGQ